jgi:hypothetical protein
MPRPVLKERVLQGIEMMGTSAKTTMRGDNLEGADF